MGHYQRNGKQVLHCEVSEDGGGCERYTSIAQADDEEKAHFLVVCANDYYDYQAEADLTNSPIFTPQNIDRDKFVNNLRIISETADVLNIFKKLLFRGKSPESLNMGPPPLLAHSLAVEFDPNNSSDATIDVLHGSLGVITEAGEVADLLLRAIEDGQRDDVNVFEEAGDMLWYINRMMRGIGKTMRECERGNINKLRGRHGATFSVERDHARNLDSERMQLEKDTGTPLFDDARGLVTQNIAAGNYTEDRKNGGENIRDKDAIPQAELNGEAQRTGKTLSQVRDDLEAKLKHHRAERETSDRMSKIAAATLSDPNATEREKSLAGSVLAQDETPGLKTPPIEPAAPDNVGNAALSRPQGVGAPMVKPVPPGGVRG